MKRLEEFEVQAQKLIEIAAGKVLQSDFADRATKEKTAAGNWTIATWVSAGLVIVLLASVFIAHLFGSFGGLPTDVGLLGTQTLLTLTLGLIAKWSSKRANRHLIEEARYHRLAVNMQTINSFIANLDKATQDAVISEVARKLYADPFVADTNTEFESSAVQDFLKGLLPKGS